MKSIQNIVIVLLMALVVTSSFGYYILADNADYCVTLCEKDADSESEKETEKEAGEDDKLSEYAWTPIHESTSQFQRLHSYHSSIYPCIYKSVTTPPPQFI